MHLIQTSLLALIFFLLTTALSAQNEKYAQVKINASSAADLQILIDTGLDLDHYHGSINTGIVIFVEHSQMYLLEETALQYHVLIPDYSVYYKDKREKDKPQISRATRGLRTASNFNYGSMGGFYTLSEIEAELDNMRSIFPSLASEKFSIGQSINGRQIWALKISDNPDIDENEPVAYYDALHHAREPLSMAVTINYMYWLLENYNTNPQVKYILDHRELYFVPCVNPDGYEYNRQTDSDGGGLWRKNRRNVGSGCYGVDLNRNYSFGYATNGDCASTNACNNTYRGTNAFSEPETTATKNFIAAINPITAFSIHSTAGSFLMPYGYNTSPPEFDIYSEWASDFASENDYPYGVTYEMLGYTSCGTTRDYLHSEGIYGWTPEIDGSGFWPMQSEIFALVDENVYPLFYQAWIAGGYVDVQSHQVTGEAIPGSQFNFGVEVKNTGAGADASAVSVSLESADPLINVSGAQSYGQVPARARIDNFLSPFTITIDASFDKPSFDIVIVVSQDGVETDREIITVFNGSKTTYFFDTAETGTSLWTASGNGKLWTTGDDDSYSGIKSWTDSDNGNGQNNSTNYNTINQSFDFSQMSSPIIEFMSKWSLDDGDTVGFEISTNGGSNWTSWSMFTNSETWHQEIINLSPLKGETDVRMRFRLSNDNSIPGDGFYYDDFSLIDYTCTTCPVCELSVINFPNQESFESTPFDWTQSANDDVNWTRFSASTPSADTGPSSARDGSWYMYIEASDPNHPAKSAFLDSPCYDLTDASSAHLLFSYHMYGTAADMELKLQYSLDGGSSFTDFAWSRTGSQGNQWNDVDIDLTSLIGNFITIRLAGLTGDTWQGDIAIDQISMTSVGCQTIGLSCDDNDPCTTNDVIDSQCICAGTALDDTDNDGICDAQDQCPGFDDALIGQLCDDGNDCTTGETYDMMCQCTGGIEMDSDNDGICDPLDECPNLDDALIGTPCDDGDDCTTEDLYNSSCQCTGTPEPDADGDGVCDAFDQCPNLDDALIGTTCDDGLVYTDNDVFTSSCICQGTIIPTTVCVQINDGNDDVEQNGNDGSIYSNSSDIELTTDGGRGNQIIGLRFTNTTIPNSAQILNAFVQFTTDETSSGSTSLMIEAHAHPDAPSFINQTNNVSDRTRTSAQTAWNVPSWLSTGDAGAAQQTPDISTIIQEIVNINTYEEGNALVIIVSGAGNRTASSFEGSASQAAQLCIEFQACALQGTACDDGDDCTIDDMEDGKCNCAGIFQDSDGDSICDAHDVCPNADDNIMGMTCDDNDPCTINDLYDANCMCSGEFQDTDGDSICDANDTCPGQNDNLIGMTCDDNDPCTINDSYTSNCTCTGELLDTNQNSICDLYENCQDTLLIDSFQYDNVKYKASKLLSAKGSISNGFNIELASGENISLMPEFELSLGSTLHMYIEACQ